MKKEIVMSTPAVPAREINFVRKLRDSINRVLPSDSQIKTVRDAWHVGAIGALALTFVFPPAVLALAYCVIKAKKGGEQ
jgi:hypothetical protein